MVSRPDSLHLAKLFNFGCVDRAADGMGGGGGNWGNLPRAPAKLSKEIEIL